MSHCRNERPSHLIILIALLGCVPAYGTSTSLKPKRSFYPTAAQKIVISVKQRGYANASIASETVIVGGPSGYASYGKEVKPEQVQKLLDVLNAPLVPALDLKNLRIDMEWAKKNSKDLLGDLTGKKRAHLQKKLSDPEFFEKSVKEIFSTEITHDWPEAKVELTLGSGTIVLKSHSRSPFMVPWKIQRAGHAEQVSFDANIGRAVADLVPTDFVNRDRIAGEKIARSFGAQLRLFVMDDEFRQMDSDKEVGSQTAPIQKKFRVKKYFLGGTSSAGMGFWGWIGDLEGGGLPDRVIINAHLTQDQKSKKLTGAQPFLKQSDSIISMIRSIPWVNSWLSSHKSAHLEIDVLDGKPTTDAMKEWLNYRYEKVKKTDELKKLLSELLTGYRAVIFEDRESKEDRHSEWVILPDGRMFLANTHGNPITKWKRSDFPNAVQESSYDPDVDSKDDYFIGAFNPPSGEIL